MKTRSILIAAFLLLILLVGCAPTLSPGDPDGEIVSNGKIAVQQGEFLYYINGSMPRYLKNALADTPQATIFRMKADGTERQQVSSKKAYDFRIYGNQIYYLSPLNANEMVIYRIQINGGTPQRIISMENNAVYALGDQVIAVERSESIVLIDPATGKEITTLANVGNVVQLFVSPAGDVYYYISNVGGIMRVNAQGENPVKVTDRNGRIVGVEGDTIYYIRNDEYLHSVDMVSGESTQLSFSTYKSMQFSTEYKAFAGVSSQSGKEGLYVMHLGDEVRTKILDQTVDAYLIWKDYVYFCNKDEKALYRVDFNGENLTKLAEVPAAAGPNTTGGDYYMDIVGDRLFFFEEVFDGSVYMLSLAEDNTLTPLNQEEGN